MIFMNKKDIEKIIDKEANKFVQKDFTEKILSEYKNDNSEMVALPEKRSNKKKIWLISIPSALAITVAVILMIIFIPKDYYYTDDLQLLNFAPKITGDVLNHDVDDEKAVDLDLNYGDKITFVATVKNLQRFSFIDIVIYRDDLETLVVYNEGHGDYICKTNTSLEDGIWVTIIELEITINSQFPKNGTIYVDDINFISSDSKHYKAGFSHAEYVKVNYIATIGVEYDMYSSSDLSKFFNENLLLNNPDGIYNRIAQINIRYTPSRAAIFNLNDGNKHTLYGTDDIDVSNYSFVFEDGYNPFNLMTSNQYLKNTGFLNKYDGGYYISSLTNPYYALVGFYEKTKKMHNDTEIFAPDLSINYDESYFKKDGNSLILTSLNNSKYVIDNNYAYKNNNGVITDLKGMNDNITNLEFNIDGATSISIASYGFYGYSKLETVNLNKVIRVDGYAFNETAIKELIFTDSLKTINMPNIKMSKLTKLTIPNTVEECNFYISEVSTDFEYNVVGNTKYIGNDINPYLICVIPNDAKEVEINSNCRFVYVDSKNLNEIDIYYNGELNDYISNVKQIRNVAYISYKLYYLDTNGTTEFNSNKYSLLETLIIPDSVSVIDDYQFNGNIGIKNIVLGDNVTTIGKYAFARIYSLENLVVDSNLKYVESNAFDGEIENVYYNGEISDYAKIEFISDNDFIKLANNCYLLEPSGNIEYMGKKYSEFDVLIIPEGTTKISDGQYKNYTMKNVVIPDTVTYIGKNAFESCDNLRSVVIPNSVTTIDEYAFAYCYSLQTVTIGENVKNLESTAFYWDFKLLEMYNLSKETFNLKEVKIKSNKNSLDDDSIFVSDENGFRYANCNGVGYLVEYTGNEKDITVPTTFNYKGKEIKVTVIAAYCFNTAKEVETITLQEGIEKIDFCPYFGGALKKIRIPKSIKEVGYLIKKEDLVIEYYE